MTATHAHPSSAQPGAILRNPVLEGFFPDPTVCRVGGDYYLACSSFDYFPGIPVFHSRDLATWRHARNAIDRDAQLPLAKVPAGGGIFAPTLRHHEGRFHLVTTNVGAGGNFLMSAEDATGPWSEPLWIDEPWFDPSLLFDGDKVYYTRRGGASSIVQAEIDIRTGKLLSPLREIATGFVSPDCEGPHLYRIGAHYFLLLAEGGSRTGHMITIGRSPSPWGPFEPCPGNPILSNRNLTNCPVRSTGHGDLFQAHDGSWWIAFLGTRHETYENYSMLGREPFILPVNFDERGWPVLQGGGLVDLAPLRLPWPVNPQPAKRDRWEFHTEPDALADPGWLHLRQRPNLAHIPDGPARLVANNFTLDDPGAPAFIGRRVPSLHSRLTVELEAVRQGECGVTFYMDHRHHLDLLIRGEPLGPVAEVRIRIGDVLSTLVELPVPPGPQILTLRLDGTSAFAHIRFADRRARALGNWDVRYLAPEVTGGWTGLVGAVFAQHSGVVDIHSLTLAGDPAGG